ncbi:MAG: hypothetical protein JOS17DRAFT_730922 [Linnemannia elongata]|nr:MAG: hypothetical protein JOS17DRAFT_730922 [Linnemannia elongata]
MDRSQEPDRAAETAELANYFSKFSAALTRLDEELARWKNYEADYQALKVTLLDLPKEISHPVMVPFGNLAFMPGKIIHTNEVLVMLGDNWFVDRSAVQAAEIVDRRMELVQENIEKLKAQEDEIRNKSGMAPGLLGGQEYNEEGLPIVEITEPYFSDDEEEKAAKAKKAQSKRGSQKTAEEQARDKAVLDRIAELELQDEEEEHERRRDAGEGYMNVVEKKEEKETDVNMEEEATDVKMEDTQILPGSQKTLEEQARDRAILDRIAELEREDEERERRREAGEDVTSDEETESDEYEEVDDDGESEDEFRPKALDSDEEYEEEVWEHSENEQDEEEEEVVQIQGSSGGAAIQKKKKGVHFAEQMSKTKKFDAMSAPSQVRSATTAPPGSQPTPVAPATATAAATKPKAKSPADLYNQMRAKQQSARAAGSDQIVNMANLESTFADLAAVGRPLGLGKAPIFETPAAEPEATALKSALKPALKKVSLFKQSRAQTETPTVVELEVEPEPVSPPAPKKLSKFAQSRAAAAAAGGGVVVGTVQERAPAPAKPAVGGISDRVAERNIPAPTFKSAPGVFEVVERHVPTVVKDVLFPTPAPVPITAIKDVIENTFTKPTSSSAPVEPASGGRRKKSLFRQQQQKSSMEPEPAVPGNNVLLSDEQLKEEEAVSQPRATAPAVASRSASSGVVVEKEPPVVVKASAKSTKAKAKTEPAVRTIPAVESSKLKDTALLKGAVVERDTIEPVDEEELEEDMLMRQVVSEYQERRQAMIAQYGAFTRDELEEMWEKQVVIPPGMIIPEAEVIGEYDEGQDDEDEEGEEEDEEEVEVKPEVVDDRNVPPKKLSLFRASRLTGSLAKQAKE